MTTPSTTPQHTLVESVASLDVGLDLQDVMQINAVETRLHPRIGLHAGQRVAALEQVSRFAVDPRWLIYLPPPTPALPDTCCFERGEHLENIYKATEYYRNDGATALICEPQHRGKRAIVVVARDAAVARRRFGVTDSSAGAIYTRSGSPFFRDNPAWESVLLDNVRDAATAAGLWELLGTDWLCLDGDLLPWSAPPGSEPGDLGRRDHAAVRVAATAALVSAIDTLDMAAARGLDVAAWRATYGERQQLVTAYGAASDREQWPVHGIADYRFAPYHLMASASGVHVDRPHTWHLDTLAALTRVQPERFVTTPYRVIRLDDNASYRVAIDWWNSSDDATIDAFGDTEPSRSIIIKPFDFIARGQHGLLLPGMKVRSHADLRLIYGAEFEVGTYITRLNRQFHSKRSLTFREFALGIEALERFHRGEPLRRVHECIFAILGLQSEWTDPRI